MRKVPPPGLLPVMLCVLILSLTSPLPAQTVFRHTYGGTDYDGGRSVAQTTDGGYIITGYTRSFGVNNYEDVWLIKTDASGDTVWTRTFGGTSDDGSYSVAQTADHGYVIAGRTRSFGSAPYSDVYLVKTDATGDTLWTRVYGGPDHDWGYSVAQTTDGGYIIAGYTESFGSAPYSDVYLVKTGVSGDTMWTRTYGGRYNDRGYSVAQTTDGGYVITGYTLSFGVNNYEDVWLLKTDANGDTLWTHTYGGTDPGVGRSVRQTADGGYVIAGHTRSFGAGYDAYLVKTDASGDTIWTRTYGGTDQDRAYSVLQTTDGGYVITGFTMSFGAGRDDVYLIKTGASGDTIWTRTWGGTDRDKGYSVHQTTDGGYIVTGYTGSFGAGSRDVWLIKTDSAGRATVATTTEPPIAHKPAPTIVHAILYLESEIHSQESEISLLDIAGRKVMDLQPGPNDVRHLAPGVYFVRPAGAVPGDSPLRAKVIVTR